MSISATEPDVGSHLAVSERWAACMFELLHQAAEEAEEDGVRAVLAGAAEDASSLRRLLVAATEGYLDPQETASLTSIFDLWDANQGRHERLAAEVDPLGHHRWLARSATARLLYEAQRAGNGR